MRLQRRTARRAVSSLMLFAVACGGASVDAPNQVTTPSSLDGMWSTRSGGVILAMALKWTRDSVTGAGTYAVALNSLGCGGTTLKGNGTVTLTAARSQSSITGYMKFDNGWTPPYIATLADSSHIDGHFMSVDRGPCPFPLYFGLVP